MVFGFMRGGGGGGRGGREWRSPFHRYKHWKAWCQIFQSLVGAGFQRWSIFTYNHSHLVAIISLLISFLLIGGFYSFSIYGRSERISLYPQNSQIFENLKRATGSGFNYNMQHEEFILMKKDESNVLNDDAFKLALEIHKGLMKIHGFQDYCITSLPTGNCSVLSPLELFRFAGDDIRDVQSRLFSIYTNQSYFTSNGQTPFTAFSLFFGNFKVTALSSGTNQSHTSKMITSGVLRTAYPVKVSHTGEKYGKNQMIERQFTSHLTEWQHKASLQGYCIVFNTIRSIDGSFDQTTLDNVPLIACSITVMMIFCAFSMSNFKNKMAGHFWLCLLGDGSVILGIAVGFCIAVFIGAPYSFIGVLAFFILAVGINNMFLIMNKLDMLRKNNIKGVQLLGNTMKDVGFSITMTTVTDIVAFIIGTLSDFPAVRIFCISALVSIFFTYMMIHTFFLAMVACDIKRMERKKWDCLVCVGASKSNETEEELVGEKLDGKSGGSKSFTTKLLHKYAQFLLLPVVKSTTIVFSIVMLGIGIYSNLNFNYRITDGEGSQQLRWMTVMEEKFAIGTFPIDIVLDQPDFDYTKKTMQRMFSTLDDIVSKNDHFENRTINWMTSYLHWRSITNSSLAFYPGLHQFLSVYKSFNDEIRFDLTTGKITASRIRVFTKYSTNWLFRNNALVSLNHQLQEGQPFYTVSFQLIYLSQLMTIVSAMRTNAIVYCVVIVIVTLPFLVLLQVSCALLISFILYILELLSVMYFWNLSFNSITMILMVMAIGFTLDYSCHIAHAWLNNHGASKDDRMRVALTTVGRSILKGGLITMIGALVLCISSSKLFMLFVKMMFSIIFLSFLHGLFILPVFITMFCSTGSLDYQTSEEAVVLKTNQNKKRSTSYSYRTSFTRMICST